MKLLIIIFSLLVLALLLFFIISKKKIKNDEKIIDADFEEIDKNNKNKS